MHASSKFEQDLKEFGLSKIDPSKNVLHFGSFCVGQATFWNNGHLDSSVALGSIRVVGMIRRQFCAPMKRKSVGIFELVSEPVYMFRKVFPATEEENWDIISETDNGNMIKRELDNKGWWKMLFEGIHEISKEFQEEHIYYGWARDKITSNTVPVLLRPVPNRSKTSKTTMRMPSFATRKENKPRRAFSPDGWGKEVISKPSNNIPNYMQLDVLDMCWQKFVMDHETEATDENELHYFLNEILEFLKYPEMDSNGLEKRLADLKQIIESFRSSSFSQLIRKIFIKSIQEVELKETVEIKKVVQILENFIIRVAVKK